MTKGWQCFTPLRIRLSFGKVTTSNWSIWKHGVGETWEKQSPSTREKGSPSNGHSASAVLLVLGAIPLSARARKNTAILPTSSHCHKNHSQNRDALNICFFSVSPGCGRGGGRGVSGSRSRGVAHSDQSMSEREVETTGGASARDRAFRSPFQNLSCRGTITCVLPYSWCIELYL